MLHKPLLRQTFFSPLGSVWSNTISYNYLEENIKFLVKSFRWCNPGREVKYGQDSYTRWLWWLGRKIFSWLYWSSQGQVYTSKEVMKGEGALEGNSSGEAWGEQQITNCMYTNYHKQQEICQLSTTPVVAGQPWGWSGWQRVPEVTWGMSFWTGRTVKP